MSRQYPRHVKILAGEHAAVTQSALASLLALREQAVRLERQRIADAPPTSSDSDALGDFVRRGQAAQRALDRLTRPVPELGDPCICGHAFREHDGSDEGLFGPCLHVEGELTVQAAICGCVRFTGGKRVP